jgi:hypothetical protein
VSPTATGQVQLLTTNVDWQEGLARFVALNFGLEGTALFLHGQ